MPNVFRCSMCFYQSKRYSEYASHIVRRHKHDANFIAICTAPLCEYITRSWGAFKVHVSRHHRPNLEDTDNEDLEDTDNEDFEEFECNNDIHNDPQKQKHLSNASFTLALEGDCNMSIKAIDTVVSEASELIDKHVHSFKQQVRQKLDELQLPYDFLDEIPVEHLLENVATDSKRKQVYKDDFSYLGPEEVLLLEEAPKTNKAGKVVRKRRYGYVIPFQGSLKRLLELPEVWYYIKHPHTSRDEYMRDVCDGRILSESELHQRNPEALQIFLNTDDIEIVNPIGTHTKKHKLTMFYYMLGNIPPECRSRLQTVQLLAVAKTVDIRKSGSDALLQDFISSVNEMSNGGKMISVRGRNELIEGSLVIVPCDTLAANWLGGFKEGVGFAYKKCRVCKITSNDMKQLLIGSQFQLRSEQEHLQQCEALAQLSPAARVYWSKMWGINNKSCLQDLRNFPICSALVQDPMHLLLEGIVPLELGYMLYSFIHESKYFDLDWLNSRLRSFTYTYLEERSKPEPITTSTDGSLRMGQTSATMLTLCCVLPYIVSVKVPRDDEKWVNFMRLVQILLLSTSPCCTELTSSLLAQLLYDHHNAYQKLYPRGKFPPKMHYCLHLPRQMLLYGPCRHHWCMRFEAKHCLFKGIKWKCFKNLALSLCTKHQKYMCFKQNSNGQPSQNYLSGGDTIMQRVEVKIREVYPDLVDELIERLNLPDGIDIEMYKTPGVCILGHHYKPGCSLVLHYEFDLPVFAVIHAILVKDSKIFFVVEKMAVEYFDKHILSYHLSYTHDNCIVTHEELFSKWPLSVHLQEGIPCVMNKYSHTCELF